MVQYAGNAAGIDVKQVCANADEAYTHYQRLLEQDDVSVEQVVEARDALVVQLDDIADGVGGPVGEFIQSNAELFDELGNVSIPDAIEAVEKAKSALDAVCR